MTAKATEDGERPLGRIARLVEAWRCFCEDVSDRLAVWWYHRFPGGPAVPWEEVKREM